ncbi:chemotaxis protein CheR [Parasulfuritortus cantonensis]|uniref:Chemotaxis protein methyltransferase n=1 Tax=Parasulfuritortus cantonensis TaxID=2528202 RepID=A0A4R1BIN3_9PROT|nr:CheR family methyltransferase [Parasulfuritortus cantonensis]TCJ17150.1 chemotaxis protein CheR [Parasulfuritortus cantonensis]
MADPIRSDREFHFSHRDFEEVRKLIYDHAGIALSDAKEDMVYSRLARRLRATGLKSFGAYLDHLKTGHEEEWEAFVNSLTTNLTDFFRENHHFVLLKDFLRQRHDHPIRLWSSASSTGEEPYSMAMTAVETFGGFDAPVRIVASDLDTNVLKKCQDGVYPIERLAKLGPERQRRFFLRGTGDRAGYARVKPELRAMVDFFQLNLLAPNWPIQGTLDAIFCRNVMIYFDKPTQHRILTRMKPLLKPDGLLFMGHSEALYHAADLFRLRGQTVYEHIEARPQRKPA